MLSPRNQDIDSSPAEWEGLEITWKLGQRTLVDYM